MTMGIPDDIEGPPRKRSRLSLKTVKAKGKDGAALDSPEPGSIDATSLSKSVNSVLPDTKNVSESSGAVIDLTDPAESSSTEILVPCVASLHNLGNTCFMNCMLQVLRFTPGFLWTLQEITHEVQGEEAREGSPHPDEISEAADIEPKPAWQFVKSAHQLYSSMRDIELKYSDVASSDGLSMAVRPATLLDSIRVLNPMFEGLFQHDAKELLSCLLCYMEDGERELKEVRRKRREADGGKEQLKEEMMYCDAKKEESSASWTTNNLVDSCLEMTILKEEMTVCDSVEEKSSVNTSGSKNVGKKNKVSISSSSASSSFMDSFFKRKALKEEVIDSVNEKKESCVLKESSIHQTGDEIGPDNGTEVEPESCDNDCSLSLSRKRKIGKSPKTPDTVKAYAETCCTCKKPLTAVVPKTKGKLKKRGKKQEVCCCQNLNNSSKSIGNNENATEASKQIQNEEKTSILRKISNKFLGSSSNEDDADLKKEGSKNQRSILSMFPFQQIRRLGVRGKASVCKNTVVADPHKNENSQITSPLSPLKQETEHSNSCSPSKTKIPKQSACLTPKSPLKVEYCDVISPDPVGGSCPASPLRSAKTITTPSSSPSRQRKKMSTQKPPEESRSSLKSQTVSSSPLPGRDITIHSPTKLGVLAELIKKSDIENAKIKAQLCRSRSSNSMSSFNNPSLTDKWSRPRSNSNTISRPRSNFGSVPSPPSIGTKSPDLGYLSLFERRSLRKEIPKMYKSQVLKCHQLGVSPVKTSLRSKGLAPDNTALVSVSEMVSKHQAVRKISFDDSVGSQTSSSLKALSDCKNSLKLNKMSLNSTRKSEKNIKSVGIKTKPRVSLERCDWLLDKSINSTLNVKDFGHLVKKHRKMRRLSKCLPKMNLESSTSLTMAEQLFGGTMAHQTRCVECERVSERTEAFMDISVPVQGGKGDNGDSEDEGEEPQPPTDSCLSRLMEAFSSVERLCGEDKYWCDTCHHYTEAERSCHYTALPTVLTLHLKRFSASSGLFSGVIKLNDKVTIPHTLPCLHQACPKPCSNTQHQYGLYAVVTHSGISNLHGHYRSYVKVSPEVMPDVHWRLRVKGKGTCQSSTPPYPSTPHLTPNAHKPTDVPQQAGDKNLGVLCPTDLENYQYDEGEEAPLWLECDDECLKVMDEEDFNDKLDETDGALMGTPYVLFYHRLDQ